SISLEKTPPRAACRWTTCMATCAPSLGSTGSTPWSAGPPRTGTSTTTKTAPCCHRCTVHYVPAAGSYRVEPQGRSVAPLAARDGDRSRRRLHDRPAGVRSSDGSLERDPDHHPPRTGSTLRLLHPLVQLHRATRLAPRHPRRRPR